MTELNKDFQNAKFAGSVVLAKDYGVTGNGTDETAKLIAALSSLSDGDTLDLCGFDIKIFQGVAGVSSGDAISIAGVPRLYNKNNITIKNGRIYADSPGVSGSKLRYPTTFTVDGCTNIRLKNVVFESKGESYGDTDASVGESSEDRREFAAQNGGHALLIVRSEDVFVEDCKTRLCGSVGSFYSMSSHNVRVRNHFSNPGSLGYAAYAFDSWAGNTGTSGFAAHHAVLDGCSASKEGYTYGSKGCVLTEDSDVTVEVNGGYFADAWPNGSARDIGYAFGCSSSQTIVNGATVEDCAAVGYTATTNGTDPSYLIISNVMAKGLRKTVHQTEDTSVGIMKWKYSNSEFEVVGGGEWAGDGDRSREYTSYVAMPNDGNLMFGSFVNCSFEGASHGFISTTKGFGRLYFNMCDIETDGWLWHSQGIGAGSPDIGQYRGIIFDKCGIRDISSETSGYMSTVIDTLYSHIDVETSTVSLSSTRDMEVTSVPGGGAFIEKFALPRKDSNIETIAADKFLRAESAKVQVITPSGANRVVRLVQPNKFKFVETKIVNPSGSSFNIVIRDYTGVTAYATLTPGQAALTWNDGATDYARVL